MAPLVVRKEIDGFVADRMLEALWREALWLVNDGVATVAEVDDAIRLGAGLRWSFMGTFLTYRIAGGEDGMRHFMAQFGPALQWPWTKLMDVPELTDELLDTIVAQSDEQAGGLSVRELEQLRDDCLVRVLQALRAHDIGAGAVLARHEQALSAAARRASWPTTTISRSRSRCTARRSRPTGSTTTATRTRAATCRSSATPRTRSSPTSASMPRTSRSGSYFTVESHLSHLREALLDDRLAVTTQVLGCDARRLHVFHSLCREATARCSPPPSSCPARRHRRAARGAGVRRRARARAAHRPRAAELPRPERAGRSIGIPR